ncbi:hypothetical protein [Bradyrhizobium sp. RDT46]|uniref:hypothetical protein n=1 Tax=Bradyrhizobium sp. RDT46 TaxID=3341829 RepID=UPI0035C7811B
MSRFILFTCMAFVTAFVGVSWAMRGFPTTVASSSLSGELKAKLTTSFGDESVKVHERKAWEAKHTLQSDKDPQLDALRMDTLQAGTAYAMSPCDKTMKANLIAATSAYARGYMKIFDCPNPALAMFCSEKKRDQANAAYSTPLDVRVQAQLAEAFDQKESSRRISRRRSASRYSSLPGPACGPIRLQCACRSNAGRMRDESRLVHRLGPGRLSGCRMGICAATASRACKANRRSGLWLQRNDLRRRESEDAP